MKYQFCIRFDNVDAQSAASKAVLDCNQIFREEGYQDYTFTVGDNSKKLAYYLALFWQIIRFYFSVKPNALIGIQYPLLSINNVFKHFIRIARLKGARFFCVVHDLESLRTGGKNEQLIKKEVDNLNYYDQLIVHNKLMAAWLKEKGVTKVMHSLELFDYLSADILKKITSDNKAIVYAGNLSKSTFVYELQHLKTAHFNLYGPGFKTEKVRANTNIKWVGQFNPDEIPHQLAGSFGLIWDGCAIDKCDEILGNYLKYNNPHKFSLYIASGLPIIAPKTSAIAAFISQHRIGILIDSLYDLDDLEISEEDLAEMRANLTGIHHKVITGGFFRTALHLIENGNTAT